MKNDVISALAELSKTNKPGALCTIIKTKGSTPRKEGSKMLVYPDGSIIGTIGGGEVEARVINQAVEIIHNGQSKILSFDLIDPDQGDPGVCGGSLEVFIDPLSSPKEIVVVGGGHVGKAVVFLAKWLGFRVILSDDREEFCNPEAVPNADLYLTSPLEELPTLMEFTNHTAIVLATRTNQVDIRGLPELLSVPSAYIGVISSKRRWKLTREELSKVGIPKKDLDRIHAPIGLDIGAESPEEIALSILAEVLQVEDQEKESG
jgi:xanthine dehydrogenase accessory factor